MKVSELKAMLADVDDDLEVIVSSDEEGNSYKRPHYASVEGAIFFNRSWNLEIVFPAPEDLENGEYDPQRVESVFVVSP